MRLIPALGAMVEQQRGCLLLWAPVALGCGIAIYFGRESEPAIAEVAVVATAGFALLLAALRAARPAMLVLLGLAALGFGAAKLQTERAAAPVLSGIHFGPVSGRVVGLDRSETNRIRLLLDRVYLTGIPAERTPARVRVVLGSPPAPEILTPGARVMMRARLTAPPPPVEPHGFDFRRHAWFERLGAIGYSAEPVVLERPLAEAGDRPMLFAMRMALAEAIRDRIQGRSGGFAAAILTGDRSGIDPRDLVDLRVSNLAHLLAISGLHMGLLTGAVFFTLRGGLALVPGLALRLPVKKLAALGAVSAGAAYLAISGASVATQRAFVMAAVIFAAVLIDRPALTLRGVAAAALIVLFWRPDSLFGAGFQMSFAATTALIAGYAALQRQAWWRAMGQGGWSPVRGGLALVVTSLVAGLATAPYSAFHFNQLGQYGLIANILAVPAMGFVVMPSALLAFALWPLGLEGIGMALMGLGIDHILNVAHWVASLDGALRLVPGAPGWTLALVSLGGIALAILRGPVRLAGVVVIAAGLASWSLAGRPEVLVDPSGRLVGVMMAEGRALNRSRGEGFAARVWLESDGDRVSQRDAAARSGDQPDGVFRAPLSGGNELVWIDPDAAPLPGDCRGEVLMIAPGRDGPPAGGCMFLGATELAAGGAHAFHAGRLSAPETAAAVTGQRPWTAPP